MKNSKYDIVITDPRAKEFHLRYGDKALEVVSDIIDSLEEVKMFCYEDIKLEIDKWVVVHEMIQQVIRDSND